MAEVADFHAPVFTGIDAIVFYFQSTFIFPSWTSFQQRVGRLHRLYDNKRVVGVYDYVDTGVTMPARMFRRRLKG